MSILINDVADYLEEEGVGTIATNVFCGYLPEDPDACIAVLDTGGSEPDKDIPTKEPTFQIMIRSTNYATGKAKLDSIRSLLHRSSNVNLVTDETYFYFILAIAEGGHLGRDDRGRDLFSINFRARTR